MSTEKGSEDRIDEAILKVDNENAYQSVDEKQKVKLQPQRTSVSMFYKSGAQADLSIS